jgi:hypothetical protein
VALGLIADRAGGERQYRARGRVRAGGRWPPGRGIRAGTGRGALVGVERCTAGRSSHHKRLSRWALRGAEEAVTQARCRASMVVNFGHVVFAQVRQLVANINKKNFKATSAELNQVSTSPRCSSLRVRPQTSKTRRAGRQAIPRAAAGTRVSGTAHPPACLRLRLSRRCSARGGRWQWAEPTAL